MKNIQALLIFIFFLLFSNKKRFPKLPGFVGKCCQIFGIFSLLIPKAYLMSLIVGNDSCTLAFGGLYLLEFIVMISFNKIFWSSFGSKHICTIHFLKKMQPIGGHSMTTWTRRGGRWSKKSLFLSTFRVKNVHVEVGGGQKRAKLCPRSH